MVIHLKPVDEKVRLALRLALEKEKQESVNIMQQLHQTVNPEARELKIRKEYKHNLFFIFAIFITGIIAYSNSFDCSLHFDDANFFEKIVTVDSVSIGNWLRLFPTRPIGILTFALNYHFLVLMYGDIIW